MGLLARLLGGAGAGSVPLGSFPSAPLPQRAIGTDTKLYREPQPRATGNFQTFFVGNQLPGTHMITPPASYRVAVRSQYDQQPQQKGGAYGAGSFGGSMAQTQAASYVARLQAAWAAAQSKF